MSFKKGNFFASLFFFQNDRHKGKIAILAAVCILQQSL